MKAVTWKRETDEPLEKRLGVHLSNSTIAELRRRAGELGVSTAEMARVLILDGLERLDEENDDQK